MFQSADAAGHAWSSQWLFLIPVLVEGIFREDERIPLKAK